MEDSGTYSEEEHPRDRPDESSDRDRRKPICTLRFDRFIREWPEEVFKYFSRAELFARWISPRACCDFRPGGLYLCSWGRLGKATGEFLEIEGDRLIKATWEDAVSSDTLVTVEFKEVGLKTHLTLTHELLSGATKAEWNEGHLNEWAFFLENLQSVIELGVDLRVEKAKENGWGWLAGSFLTPLSPAETVK